jgi:hypothetical protein
MAGRGLDVPGVSRAPPTENACSETAFQDAGIRYERAEKNKSVLCLEALPLFMCGAIRIPDLPALTREFRLLERQTHRSGRETVDHGRHGSDDYANALCGCAAHAVKRGGYGLDDAMGRRSRPRRAAGD